MLTFASCAHQHHNTRIAIAAVACTFFYVVYGGTAYDTVTNTASTYHSWLQIIRSQRSITRTGHCVQLQCHAGLHYDSRTEQWMLGINARKNFQLGKSETWLKVSQDAFFDPKTQKVCLSMSNEQLKLA